MTTLVSISYSPWSERARFALDAQGVPYTTRSYIPMVGEPSLRWTLRRPLGRVTVPVLIREDGPPLDDSLDIALWGAARGARNLAPESWREQIRRWRERSEPCLDAGRILTTLATLDDPGALHETLPPPIRRLGPLGMAMGRNVAGLTLRKYAVDGGTDAEALLDQQRAVLEEVRQALGGRQTLLDDFSLADIFVAVSMSFVCPPPRNALGLGERSQRCWTRPELTEAYADVLAWRDGIYTRHRWEG